MPSGVFGSRAIWVLLVTPFMTTGCLSGESPNQDSSAATKSNTGNNPPIISGAPSNGVLVGDVYTFTPTASDPDGDRLTFSVINKPRWASFDSSTGRLSGQAVLGDEGIYSQIRISVSDGTSSATLPDFSVEVTQGALGAMTLSWTAPTENADGSPLTDLAGYVIYYGESPGIYPNRIPIDNPGITSFVVEDLLPRTYYVVATAFNSAGVESGFSNETSKTVTAP